MALSYARVVPEFPVSSRLAAWLAVRIGRYAVSFFAARIVLAGRRHDAIRER